MNTSADLLKQLRIDRQRPATPPPARRSGWIIAALIIVIVLAAAAWWFTRRPVVKVQTAPVVAISAGSSSASVLDASGYVVARRMSTVSAQVTGKVREVMIEEGTRVEQGQVMATLDPLDADAQRTLSASQLSAARSQVDNMQAQLAVANADATRLQSLVGAQLVSRSQYDQAIAQRDALRAQLQNAQRNVQVASDQLAIAGIRSDFNVVRAPFAGVVTAKAEQPGEIVSPLSAGGGFTRTGIGTIVDMESLEIEVEVGESYIGRVQPKMPVEAVLNAYPEWKIPGEVIAIIPTADRGKATVKVRVATQGQGPAHRAGDGCEGRLSGAGQTAAGSQTARRARPGRCAGGARHAHGRVRGWRAHNTVSAHAVTTGMVMGEDRQVLSGLTAGDSVVLNPPQALKDGDKVTDAKPDAAE
ncbi:efflux RND transporter periplasmic adaptor subunit (plasmid) [Xanthomonas axonopodis pv. vasculorum]